MSETTVKGLVALQAALDSLPAKIEANIMRGALRAGAKVMLDEAKRLVPVGDPSAENKRLYGGRPGLLRDSIRIKTKLKAGKVTASVVAGGDPYYARFVEYGTKPHIIKAGPGKFLPLGNGFLKSVQHPGARKRPFMRPALDTGTGRATQAAADYIRQRLANKHGIDVPAPLQDGDE